MNKCCTLGLIAAVCLLFTGNSLSTQAITIEHLPPRELGYRAETCSENALLVYGDTGDNATGVLAQAFVRPHEISDSSTLFYYYL